MECHLKKANFIELLPDSLKNNSDIIKFSSIIDNYLFNIDNIIDKLTIYARLDDNTLEEEYVDALARTFHLLANESYRFAGTVEQKRELVRNALILHKTKGTKYAVERVCNILDLKEARLTEWFEDDGEPYTFKINANAFDGLNEETIRLLYAMIDEFKNIRSHVAVFEFENNSYGTIYCPTFTFTHTELNTYQQLYLKNDLLCEFFCGAGIYLNNNIVIEASNEFI